MEVDSVGNYSVGDKIVWRGVRDKYFEDHAIIRDSSKGKIVALFKPESDCGIHYADVTWDECENRAPDHVRLSDIVTV